MKLKKRIVSIVTALAMAASMACTSMAAVDTEKHNLTVTGPKEAENKPLTAYQIFQVDDGAYVLNSAFAGYFVGKSGIAESDTDAVKSEKAYLYVKSLTTETKPTIQQFANDFEAWARKNSTATATGTLALNTAEDGTVVTLSVPYGYYLLYGNQTPASLFNFKAGEGGDTVALKSDYPTVDKTVDEGKHGTTADIGKKVDYTLASKVPDTTGYTTYTFKFVDTLSKGLTFNDDVNVKVGETKLEKDKDYKVTSIKGENDATVVTIDLSKSIMNQTKAAAITVTYSATVNTDVEIEKNANTNSVKVVYSNNPNTDSTGESEPSDTKVYSFKIDINKVSGSTNAKLPDAKFVLYRKVEKDGASVMEYYYLNTTEGAKEAAWTEHSEIKEPEDIIAGEKITVITTDVNGAAVIKGLAEGTYMLQEIAAPNGYNKLDTPTKITITATIDENSGALTNWKINDNAEMNSSVQVVNNTGATLPETGAMGTLLFSILGVLLVIGGTLMMNRGKRENG